MRPLGNCLMVFRCLEAMHVIHQRYIERRFIGPPSWLMKFLFKMFVYRTLCWLPTSKYQHVVFSLLQSIRKVMHQLRLSRG
ncbi:hypothetical protein JOM56_001645 [Amanita muscaria]